MQPMMIKRSMTCLFVLCAAVFSTATAHAIQLDNPSFEGPLVDGAPALPFIDAWTEFDLPIPNGDQVTGVFPNPAAPDSIANVDQNQVAFMSALGGLGIGIAQSSVDTFVIGRTYDVAVWLGKSGETAFGTSPPDDAEITVRLFYGDVSNALNPAFEIASTSVLAGDLSSESLMLTSFSSNLVTAGDAWAGQPIGIAFLPTAGDNDTTPNTFNIDNVSITEIPEPASVALLGLGILAIGRRRRD